MENKNKKDGCDEGGKENEGFCFKKDKEENREKAYLAKQQSLLLKKRKKHKGGESEEEKENKTFFTDLLDECVQKNNVPNNSPKSPSILFKPYRGKQSRLAFYPINEKLNMRCKADRAKLYGWDCWECREYYKNLSLSKEELQKRKNQCSRYRQKYERPNTPEGFWDPEFSETL